MFFASYFDAPYEGSDLNAFFNNIAKANFSTMRGDLEDFKREVIDTRTKKSVTIQNEVLRSYQEVEIANFLYLNNIDYEYEPIYKYDIEFSRKPYTPDFIIYQGEKSAYLEHFGITESGENDRFTPEEIERYKKAVRDKCILHKEHGTTLIYTFSAYNDGRSLLDQFVIRGDRSIDYAEERRLFYVAMTRTKNRVFFVAPEANPSEFLLELKQSYKNVKLLGEWNEKEPVSIAKKPCPLCGYPMQFKYKRSYGLRLYICTNEPEICGFMTNNYQAGKLSIQKCDKCRDGYLIVKQGRDKDFFLGCTNYKQNGTGCSRMISKQAYYSQMGYKIWEGTHL